MSTRLDKTLKTKDDQQAMLVFLLIIFVVAVKCYMIFAPPQQIAEQQKAKNHTTQNKPASHNYSKTTKPLLKGQFN